MAAAVEEDADPGGARPAVVGPIEGRDGEGDAEEEFDEGGGRQGGHGQLDGDERDGVDEVNPVGGIGEVAAERAGFGAAAEEETDEAVDHEPAGEGGAGGDGEEGRPEAGVALFEFGDDGEESGCKQGDGGEDFGPAPAAEGGEGFAVAVKAPAEGKEDEVGGDDMPVGGEAFGGVKDAGFGCQKSKESEGSEDGPAPAGSENTADGGAVEAVEVTHQGEGEEEGPEQSFEEPHVTGFEGLGEAAAGEPVEGGGEGFGSAGGEAAVETEGAEDGEDGDEGEEEGDAETGHPVFEHGLPAALFLEKTGEEAGHHEEDREAKGVDK